MQAVFCLVKHFGLRPFQHFLGNFLAAVCRQAVQNHSVRACHAQQFFVNLVIAKRFLTDALFGFLSHTCPNICIKNVCAFGGTEQIFINFNGAAGKCGIFLRGSYNFRVRLVAFRRCANHIHAYFGTGIHQRMRHIVAVANINQLTAF